MDKKKSETLRQREKAQKDLLELKKMRAGLLDTEHLDDSDKKIVPRTLEEKADNFFYHHKYKVIISAFLAIVLAIMIGSCVTKVRYDATVTIYCYEYVDQKTVENIEGWLETYYEDVNGNGKVEILCTDCSFSNEGTELAETINQKQMKMQAILTDSSALLFILDDESIEYLNGISENFVLFTEENIVELEGDFYMSLGRDRISFKNDKKRYLCLRTIDETVIENKAKDNYAAAKKVLEKYKG